MSRKPPKPSAEKIAAQRVQLREQERIEARRMWEELKRTKRLPERDRARVVRNLGGMVETMWRDRPSEGARELFRRAYGDSEPNRMKKRQRYMRFESEPLPEERLGPGEYCATGATFAKLADAYADLAEDSSNDDAKLRAVMRLVEGTSLDRRGQARGIRENEDARRALVDGFAKLRDEVLREVNLGLVFSTFARYPLQAFYSVPDLLRSVHDSGDLRVLEPDLRKAGLDLAELKGLPPGTLEERTAGLYLPHDWLFMRTIEPSKLAIDRGAEPFVPGELVGGLSTDYPHWVLPRVRIGTAYFPGHARLTDLNLDRRSLDNLDPGTLDSVIEAARDATRGDPAKPRRSA
jgi:hypothetical protein